LDSLPVAAQLFLFILAQSVNCKTYNMHWALDQTKLNRTEKFGSVPMGCDHGSVWFGSNIIWFSFDSTKNM